MVVYLFFRVKQMKQVWRCTMANELWGNENNNTQMLTKIFFREHLKLRGLFNFF